MTHLKLDTVNTSKADSDPLEPISTDNDPNSQTAETEWYIIKNQAGQCEILDQSPDADQMTLDQWGPFTTQSEAFARRVGLIRAGKCNPA